MDSRDYVFIYPLETNSDIPGDFPREVRRCTFEAGIFLPQDDSSWFTRPPQYPARLLLLEGRRLQIIPHPTSAHLSTEIKLDELLQLETGTVLLHGWLRFTTPDGVQEIVYNTRASQPLEKLLLLLKQRWLGIFPAIHGTHTDCYGDKLDIKFRNSLLSELDRSEAAVAQYFEAPARTEKKIVLWKRVCWRPGNLILLTSRNRLLWITDQYKGRREPYASISFSVPYASFQNCAVENAADQVQVTISFRSGFSWRIPVHRAAEQYSSFCQRLPRTAAIDLHLAR
jgi:hypothetical protein